MPETDSKPPTGSRWQALEFSLVVVMLAVLTLLVLLILLPIANPGLSPEELKSVPSAERLQHHKALLDYRKDLLSIVLTAFGAWIGAGAAYFFGRENLREAASSLLKMSGNTGADRLSQIKIQAVPPHSIEWKVKTSDTLKTVVDKLKQDNSIWFVPAVGENGVLVDVIHKEGVWRYLIDDPAKAATVLNDKVSDLIAFLQKAGNEQLSKQFSRIYVAAKPDTTVAAAHDAMLKKNVFIAIVTDADGKPVSYIDTADVRRLLLT